MRCFPVSVSYYIVDTARRDDFKKLAEFWDSGFKNDVFNLVKKYSAENGIAEESCEILLDEIKERLTYFPVSEDYYEDKIGYVSAGKFYFSFNYYGRFRIGSVQELKEFLKTRPGFALADEYGEIADIDELIVKK